MASEGQILSKKQKMVGEKLFKLPETSEDKPKLLATRCLKCGEVVFPCKLQCPNCFSKDVEQITIGPKGKLYSFTVVYQNVPDGYKGPVPYGVVKVEMPEGIRVTGYCTENNPDKFTPNMEMEIVVDKLFEDGDGKEITGFKFKPIHNSSSIQDQGS